MMKKKTVVCKICCKAFERFATQPEGKYGWRCSSECIQEDAKRRNAKACVKCNRLCITTKAKVCFDCKTRTESAVCEFCGDTCNKTRNKHQFCDRNCRRKFLRRVSVTLAECKWCGKDFKKWIYAKGDRGGGQFCSQHCKHSSKRLKQYVREKSGQAVTFAAYRKINEHWIACRLKVLEKENAEKTEEQQWAAKIHSLCNINRYREEQKAGVDRSRATKHKRNLKSDWRHGGAWNRIVFSELQTLTAKVNQTEEQLWFMRVFNQLCSQRKRMRKKQVAGCRHGD